MILTFDSLGKVRVVQYIIRYLVCNPSHGCFGGGSLCRRPHELLPGFERFSRFFYPFDWIHLRCAHRGRLLAYDCVACQLMLSERATTATTINFQNTGGKSLSLTVSRNPSRPRLLSCSQPHSTFFTHIRRHRQNANKPRSYHRRP